MESFFDTKLPLEDPVIVFLIILFFFLFSPLFAKRFRLPGIIGLILSGIILGPYGINLVSKDIGITMFGTVGLLYLMFLAGLEINLTELSKQRKHGITFGILTFIIPLFLGIIITWIVLGMPFMNALLFSSIFSTHTLISYPILSRYGLTSLKIAGVAISGTIITDSAVLMMLTIVTSLSGGETAWFFFFKLTMFFIILIGVVILFLPYAARWLLGKLQGESGYQFIAVLMFVFFAGFLAKVLGIEPIIGAFFAGLALNKLIPQNSPLMNRIVFIGNNLFIPFFLLSVGMLIDISALFSGLYVLIVSTVIISVAIVSKFLAACTTQLLFGYSALERNLLFGLSTSHAAATIAVTLVGYQAGLFDENLMNVSILLILVSCLIGSVVTEKASRRISFLQKKDDQPDQYEQAERILVPLANPATLDFLMSFAFTIKQKDSGEPIYPLTVLQDDVNTSRKIMKFNKQLEKYQEEASSTEENISPMVRVEISVVDGILRAVKEKIITKIIIGWNGKLSASNYILGSLLDKLIEKVDSMIMIVKIDKQLENYRSLKIFIPPDLEYEPGFNDCINTFLNFSSRLKKEIEFFCEGNTRNYLDNGLKLRNRDIQKFRIHEYASWDAFQTYSKNLHENELLIFVNARPRSFSSHSNLENIPRILTRFFKNRSFILVYPEIKLLAEESLSSSLGS
jgi:Kef-type K+ transport system membrane component KefB